MLPHPRPASNPLTYPTCKVFFSEDQRHLSYSFPLLSWISHRRLPGSRWFLELQNYVLRLWPNSIVFMLKPIGSTFSLYYFSECTSVIMVDQASRDEWWLSNLGAKPKSRSVALDSKYEIVHLAEG